MGISWDKGMDDFAKELKGMADKVLEDEVVDLLVEQAREDGLSTVDSIQLNLTTDTKEVKLNEARARERANRILAEGRT